MRDLVNKYTATVSSLRDLPPLFFRLILAYGFYEPALQKYHNIEKTAEWFASMNYPAPLLNVYLAMATEFAGVALLTLGLATRFISIPLMFVMVIAITTVHWNNGFACGDKGFEIPLYYFLMLFSLLVTGAGRISLDYLIRKNTK